MPAVTGVWGPNVWGPNVWGANVWGTDIVVIETAVLDASISSGPVLSATILNYPMSDALIVGSTNEIVVKGLKRRNLDGTKDYLDDADVELTALLDANGDTVPGTQNIEMPFISGVGKSGVYGSVIPHTVPLVAGQTYTRRFTATDVDGNVRVFDRAIPAVVG